MAWCAVDQGSTIACQFAMHRCMHMPGKSKDPSGDATQHLDHERRIIARLAGIEGVVSLPGEQADAIRPQDDDAQPLAKVLAEGPLELVVLLELALHLAQTLAAMHRR